MQNVWGVIVLYVTMKLLELYEIILFLFHIPFSFHKQTGWHVYEGGAIADRTLWPGSRLRDITG